MNKYFTVLLGLIFFTSAWAQHRIPFSLIFEYPKGTRVIRYVSQKDTIKEGIDFKIKGKALPAEARKWQMVYDILNGSLLKFQPNSIPDQIDSLHLIISRLAQFDTVTGYFQNISGEKLWLFIEVSVFNTEQINKGSDTFLLMNGKPAYLKIPLSPILDTLWRRSLTFVPQESDDISIGYLINGKWTRQGAGWEIDREKNELRIFLPRLGRLGGSNSQFGKSKNMEDKSKEEKSLFVQNFPNPFNPITRIEYIIPSDGYITLKVYNSIGNEIMTLASGFKPKGMYEVYFDGSNLPSGIYFYTLTLGGKVQTNKMTLLK